MGSAADRWKEIDEENSKKAKPTFREQLGQFNDPSQGPLVPPAPVPVDPANKESDIATMSAERLVQNVSRDPSSVSTILASRPTMAGELLQQAFQSGRKDAALTLIGGLRAGFSKGSAQQRELLFRAVLRVEGPGAKEARDVIRAVIRAEGGEFKPQGPFVPGTPIIDPRLKELDAAESDPKSARFRANFRDRPDESARQLLEEAEKDPQAYRRHLNALPNLILNAPESARQLSVAVMQLKGTKARDVNLRLIGMTQAAVAACNYSMDEGIDNEKPDGPRAVAERIAPTLSMLASNPENARALVQLSRRRQAIPGTRFTLHDVFHAAMHSGYSDETRAKVQRHITEGAAGLFQDSLTADSRDHRRARTMDAARFVGEASRVESETSDMPLPAAIGEMLQHVAPMVAHPAASQVVSGVGTAAKTLSPLPAPPKWSSGSTEDMMRFIYESVHPMPPGALEDPAVLQHYDAFVEWQADGIGEFNRMKGAE